MVKGTGPKGTEIQAHRAIRAAIRAIYARSRALVWVGTDISIRLISEGMRQYTTKKRYLST